jgi:hypothetical protein
MEALLERLSYEPWSLYRAKQLGGPQWFGYSADSERLNALLDGQRLQTKAASGRGRAYLKDSEMAPRPGTVKASRVVSSKDTAAMAALFGALG